MTDFLLELRSEEIPARMQDKAREDLERLFAAELAQAGLAAAQTVTYATPRRLALIARGLPDETAAVSEETKGPKTSAPEQALEGFLRKTGLARDQLVERDGVYFAIVERPGRATAAVLAEAIPAIVRAFPWPKSMRWGAASLSTESLRWVRPLQGIVALLGDAVVPVEIAGVTSGRATAGHRFMHTGEVTITSPASYLEDLRAAHVIADQEERRAIIHDHAGRLAAGAGLELIPDAGLVNENSGLTEWPVPLLGRFDVAFLAVPPEVIQLTARVHQKYFVCRDLDGSLANAFICTANIHASDDGAAIVAGNQKVLAARLADARFFYEQDFKVPLEEQAEKLDKIVFHEKLGTVADKVDRVAKLARWLVEEGIVKSSPRSGEGDRSQSGGGGRTTSAALAESPLHHPPAADGPPPRPGEDLAALAERAARLCKADLVTGMVGEFPELQGLMGGYYAAAQGEDPRVAAAIRDHYKPAGQGDEVPTDPVTVAVSLADKLDTLIAFFAFDLKPSGSKDPFALRRAALAFISLIEASGTRIRLFLAYEFTSSKLRVPVGSARGTVLVERAGFGRVDKLFIELLDFFADRLKVQQREAGVRHDLIDAVFALGGEDDLVRLLARVRALQTFIGTADGANLLAGYKRAANILKKEGWVQPQPSRHPGPVPGSTGPLGGAPAEAWMPEQVRHDDEGRAAPFALSYTPEPAEKALMNSLDSAEPAARAAVATEDFAGAMAALATLRAPIDAFFESVTVNDPDPDKRAARLALLARMRDAVHAVADFSRIEG